MWRKTFLTLGKFPPGIILNGSVGIPNGVLLSGADNENSTLPESGGPEHREMWQERLREVKFDKLFQSVKGTILW